MKKIILLMMAIMLSVVNLANAKAIYYPVYVTDVEVYNSDTLSLHETIKGVSSYNLNMGLNGCSINVVSNDSIVDFIKQSINARRAATWAAIGAAASATGSILNSTKAITSRNKITGSLYVTKSYFYLNEYYRNLNYMMYFKNVMWI